ncbi:MAG: hypothetical protein Q8Q04_01400 [archaeon]|nr:hypothetical protein [archaeon]
MREIESRKDMVKFFERNLESGRDAGELYSVLLNQGYIKSMINEGYNQALANINKRKQKDEIPQPKIEIVTTSTPEKKKGFFSRLFKRD